MKTANATNYLLVATICFLVVSGGRIAAQPQSTVSSPPTGMALIPTGAFMMGDSLDGDELLFGQRINGDATPTVKVQVSAFYMDKNLVTTFLPTVTDSSIWLGTSKSGFGIGTQPMQEVVTHAVRHLERFAFCVVAVGTATQQYCVAQIAGNVSRQSPTTATGFAV